MYIKQYYSNTNNSCINAFQLLQSTQTYHSHPHRLGESVGGTTLRGLRQSRVGQVKGGLITGVDDVTQGQHGHPQPHRRSIHNCYHRLGKGDQSLSKIPENVSDYKSLKNV